MITLIQATYPFFFFFFWLKQATNFLSCDTDEIKCILLINPTVRENMIDLNSQGMWVLSSRLYLTTSGTNSTRLSWF